MSEPDLVLLHAPSVYDFRKKSILYGPVSDLIPSTTVFEMYPIGFTTIAEYLERYGIRVRIVNLALHMLRDHRFDVEAYVRRLKPRAFGIDLHWLPHAHGALEVARIVKEAHPEIPLILGGFSATYFHKELIIRPEVDYVIRGDSAEAPMLQLMRHICADRRRERRPSLEDIPNLTWKDTNGQVYSNPVSYVPENLDHVLIDYSYVVKAVVRYRDLIGFVPVHGWLRYPITAALTCRGCTHNCRTCGGSATAFHRVFNRQQPAFRAPEDLARDIRDIGRFSQGPIFVLGDIRQAGPDYAERFLQAIQNANKPLILEIFNPASRDFLMKIGQAVPGFTLEISPESHDEEVRAAFGRHYSNQAMEETIAYALEAGCRRVDIFFMIGLPGQTYQSVLDTAAYCDYLIRHFNRDDKARVCPFISPLAPFLDPGSLAFEEPEKYGYRLFCRSLEEHRQALVQPSWKYVLNYETQWMDRGEIVASTYEVGLRFNHIKAKHGLIDPHIAETTERRIRKAIHLIRQIDDIVTIADEKRRTKLLAALKPQVDMANLSTVCDKRELELPGKPLRLNLPRAATIVLQR
ncbi:MAG: TIGR04190 family B12-binding domain/radical SAM domain protein [Anaerolineae bacterium]|jgi:B12-binding domain/radical SAM domain protein|nr:TIGR04190 family B12-binding domain/radical SAM domain protein [Anaerolineae bacterium]MDH7475663.1 TIGR04190 family B12-binding domain/radical SAM domain protein [Anaerolineae bacterium]